MEIGATLLASVSTVLL